MTLLNQLSSQVGDRTEYSNRKVALKCLEQPTLLDEIVKGLKSKDAALPGDRIEVLTKVAEEHPEWVAPHAKQIASFLTHKTTRVRWEAMHALALVAAFKPQVIEALLPQLGEKIRCDPSVIVRDYAVQAIGNYAATSSKAAQAAYPYLRQALAAWDGKQAGHALNGLAKVAVAAPKLRDELRTIGVGYTSHRRGVVRKAAEKLLAAIE
jgi:HEAT repeat protein